MNSSKISHFYMLTGLALEHFDNVLFGLFASSITRHYIPYDSKGMELFTFSLFFFFRPLGAFILGRVSERSGRRMALLISITMMSIATLLLGLCPSYDQIGATASLIFIVSRIVQGLSVGGEFGLAMTYADEQSPINKKSFYGAMVVSATHVGGMLAAICAYLWYEDHKISFLLAGILGLASVRGRAMLLEAKSDLPGNGRVPSRGGSLKYLASAEAWQAIAAGSYLVAVFYAILIFFNFLLKTELHLGTRELFQLNILLFFIWIVCPLLVGYIVDLKKLSYRAVMLSGVGSVVFIAAVAGFCNDSLLNVRSIVALQCLLSVAHSIYCSTFPRHLCQLFPVSSRGSLVTICYALGSSFTAGITPLICHQAFARGGLPYLMFLFGVFTIAGFYSVIGKPKLYSVRLSSAVRRFLNSSD